MRQRWRPQAAAAGGRGGELCSREELRGERGEPPQTVPPPGTIFLARLT